MPQDSIVESIRRELMSWEGVQADFHHSGMIVFHVGHREIGHLHGSRMADIPFPVRIREKLVAAGRAEHHYLHPQSGWVTRYIRGDQDIEAIIDLLRLNYERPWLKQAEAGSRSDRDAAGKKKASGALLP